MKIIYFDTNIYNHIHKKDCIADAGIQLLYEKVQNKSLLIVQSLFNIEEIFSAFEKDCNLAIGELTILKSFAENGHIIKDPMHLLYDDITGYVKGNTPCCPFISDQNIRLTIDNFLKNPATTFDSVEITEIIDIVHAQKKTFQTDLLSAQNFSPLKKTKKIQYPFELFLKRNQKVFAEQLVNKYGLLDECKKKGIAGLLNFESISLYIGIGLSFTYALEFEKRLPQKGDLHDQLHALSASVADIFVTNDNKFLRLLKRIPVDNFIAMNLGEFLEYLSSV